MSWNLVYLAGQVMKEKNIQTAVCKTWKFKMAFNSNTRRQQFCCTKINIQAITGNVLLPDQLLTSIIYTVLKVKRSVTLDRSSYILVMVFFTLKIIPIMREHKPIWNLAVTVFNVISKFSHLQMKTFSSCTNSVTIHQLSYKKQMR